jgi:serine/threonine-protein kinase HipA
MIHGFLHVGQRKWRLAPAFDINPFPERIRELKAWISAVAGPSAAIEALLLVTPYFRISLLRAKKILSEVEGAVSGGRKEGKSLGMSKLEHDQFSDAFEYSERKQRRKRLVNHKSLELL